MFIRSLRLQNVLSFRESVLLELRPLNILIGTNGSGKSNFIDCIELLHWLPQSLSRFLSQRGGADAWLWKGEGAETEPARIACEFESGDDYKIAFRSLEGGPNVQEEKLHGRNLAVHIAVLQENSE
jgi:predicted ATPase